jgi:archaellum biogenesis ATPase FlaH
MESYKRSGVNVARVRTKELQWLWRGYIPLGKVSILEGDPNLGKSLLAADLVSRVTTTGVMPDGTKGSTGEVEMWCAEDDLEDTIRPRLEAAGCNLSRVRYSNDFDLKALKDRLAAHPQTRLLVIDPFSALMMFQRKQANEENEVRDALQPFIVLAQQTGIAIVFVRHWNKSDVGKAIYKGSGSIAISAAARSTMMVAAYPADEEIKILASVKCNLAQRPSSLKFCIHRSHVSGHPAIEWLGPTTLCADDLTDQGPRLTKVNLAASYIEGLLAHGEMSSQRFDEIMKAKGYALRTAERARRDVNVRAFQRDREWFVALADETGELAKPQTASPPDSQTQIIKVRPPDRR